MSPSSCAPSTYSPDASSSSSSSSASGDSLDMKDRQVACEEPARARVRASGLDELGASMVSSSAPSSASPAPSPLTHLPGHLLRRCTAQAGGSLGECLDRLIELTRPIAGKGGVLDAVRRQEVLQDILQGNPLLLAEALDVAPESYDKPTMCVRALADPRLRDHVVLDVPEDVALDSAFWSKVATLDPRQAEDIAAAVVRRHPKALAAMRDGKHGAAGERLPTETTCLAAFGPCVVYRPEGQARSTLEDVPIKFRTKEFMARAAAMDWEVATLAKDDKLWSMDLFRNAVKACIRSGDVDRLGELLDCVPEHLLPGYVGAAESEAAPAVPSAPPADGKQPLDAGLLGRKFKAEDRTFRVVDEHPSWHVFVVECDARLDAQEQQRLGVAGYGVSREHEFHGRHVYLIDSDRLKQCLGEPADHEWVATLRTAWADRHPE